MELKKGYKKTEVGVIPEEWDTRSIRFVCQLVNGRGFKPFEWDTNGLPIIRIQNLNGSEEFNYYSGQFNPKILIEPGQLLFAWSGSKGTSFGPHVWNGQRALLNYHTWKVVVNETKAYKDFLFYSLRKLTTFIEDKAHGASALVHVQKWEMEKFPIAIPNSLKEQHAIASALSDVDALLESLDRLIDKKRNIKQAAMQQLLTGKKRLPGFEGKKGYKQTEIGEIPEDWDIKTLFESVEFLDGKRRPIKDSDRAKMRGDIPYFGASGIVDYVNSFIFNEDLILLGEDGENIVSRNCRLAFKITGKTWVNNHAHVLRPKPIVLLDFLVEFLESLNYEQYNTGTAQPKLNKFVCSNILVIIPPISEQAAIATTISDMDAEITALEKRRDKTKSLKQAMIQELLTGKTRLI